MTSNREITKKFRIKGIALLFFIPIVVMLIPSLAGATQMLNQAVPISLAGNCATVVVQAFEVEVPDGGDNYFRYTYTLTNEGPAWMIFALDVNWGGISLVEGLASEADNSIGTVDAKEPPVDDSATTSTRLYATAPILAGNTFAQLTMYFPELLDQPDQQRISIMTNLGGAGGPVTYEYDDPGDPSVPEPASIFLVVGAFITLGLFSRTRKMLI